MLLHVRVPNSSRFTARVTRREDLVPKAIFYDKRDRRKLCTGICDRIGREPESDAPSASRIPDRVGRGCRAWPAVVEVARHVSGGHENPVKPVKAGRCPSVNSRDAPCSPRVTVRDQGQRRGAGPSSATGRRESVPSGARKRQGR